MNLKYGGSGQETEVPKSSLTLTGSGYYPSWEYVNAKDSVLIDPGWHNLSYTGTAEYLRIDLGSPRTVSRVGYLPRVMSASDQDGTWNGVYRQYGIYVTDDGSGTPGNWGAPVASGEWSWPNLQERRDVSFTPKTGRYVYLRRVTAWGWYTPANPGFASADEIWVYESAGGGGGWTLAGETRYIYDGMRVIQERDGNNVPTVVYTRGNDLSGSLEGAGGIGGLLARSHGYAGGNFSTHSFYHADGNGNVTYLVSPAQVGVAEYRYDPYGNLLSTYDSLPSPGNRYRFSSKEQMPNSGLYYYGYRFYDPNLQRWLNRDPIGEQGFEALESGSTPSGFATVPAEVTQGANVYAFVGNGPTGRHDADGRWSPPFLVFLGFTLRCGIPYYIAASLKFGDDKMRHCYASCMIARDCGTLVAYAGGLTHEIADEVFQRGGGWDPQDMVANEDGLDCAGPESHCSLGNFGRWFRKSCATCCTEKGYAP